MDPDSKMLPQEGNPIKTALDNYKRYLTGERKWGDIVVSWQFKNGAHPKSGFDHEYQNGIATEVMRAAAEKKRKGLGTLDNLSTITELASLGYTYKTYKVESHKTASCKTMDYLLEAQRRTGGYFPILIKDVGMVGTITVSGLPEDKDHQLVVDTIRDYLKL